MKIFLIFLTFLALSIEAKLKIEISQGSKDLPKIAIVPFKSNMKIGESISMLIEDNLTLFGEFSALPKNEMLSFPSKEENFFYRDWNILNVDYVVIGNFQEENSQFINIEYFVFNISLNKLILRGDVSGNYSEKEKISKVISNRVYKSITGLNGVFDTKIAYILNPSREELSLIHI